MKEIVKSKKSFYQIKLNQLFGTIFFKGQILLMALILSACNPAKTKLGENFLAGISISLSNSTLSVSNSQVATSSSVTVTLNLKDQNGAAYISNRPVITFSKSGGTSIGTLSAVTNLGNGSYTATFTGVTPGTATTIRAQVDGQELTTTLPTVQVTTGNFSLSNSLITVSSATLTSNSTITATLTVKDTSNSQLPDGGLTVVFSYSAGSSTGVFSAVTDNLNGTYTATFTGITAGTATEIHATIGGASVTSSSPTVTVNVGAATKLAFVQEPTNIASGSTISPNVTVRALDVNNNFVSTYATDIVVSIDTNPSGGTLSGTLTKTPSSGVSTFNDLTIDYYGTAYKLSATSGSLTAATSATFNVTATALTYDLPFTSVTTPAYTTLYTSSSWTLMDFIGDLVRLTPTVQTDDAATSGTMDAGTASGVVIGTLADGTSTGLKLGNAGGCNGSSTNCAELDSSWTPQWASLVSYWKMNNSWSDSIGSKVTTPVNSATFSTSAKLGSHAATLSLATSDYATVANSSFTSTTSTICSWFKTSSAATTSIIYSERSSSSQAPISGQLYTTSSNVAFIVRNDSNTISLAQGTTVLSNNTWYHACGVRNGANVYIYLNGIQEATVATAGGVYTVNRYTIGSYYDFNASVYQNSLNGTIDDLAIWSAALTTNEIQTIYDRQKSAYSGIFTSRILDAKSSSSWTTLSWIPTLPFMKELPDYVSAIQNETSANYSSLVGSTGSTGANDLMTGLVGLWHLNETLWADVASEVKDDSGNANPGRAKNGANTTRNGKFGYAGIFDGANDYVDLGATTAFDFGTTTSFTLSSWIKYSTCSLNRRIISNGSASSSNGWALVCAGSSGTAGQIMFFVGAGGDITKTIAILTQTSSYNDGNWHHISISVDQTSKTVSVYIDGVLAPISLLASTCGSIVSNVLNYTSCATNANNSGLTTIGSDKGTGNYWDGQIDEVAIWNRALHANEVKQLYQRGASRLKYQVRSCDDNACSGESWQGPDGTNGTYFSELNNNTTPLTSLGDVKTTLPSILFSNFTSPVGNNQYFQYRTIFESDSSTAALMPELKSVSVDPIHYPASSPSIYGNNGIAFSELNAFTETLGSGGCSSGVGYNLSLDKATWKYWNGSAWVTANGSVTQSNTAAVIQTNSASFGTQVGRGTVYVKAYLKSSGTSKCELDNIQIGGNR